MTPARRVFVLLGAFEDLTEREGSALRRGDFGHAVALGTRKKRLAGALVEARRNAVLSGGDLAAFNQRVRTLEADETSNLAFLREEMIRVGDSLQKLDRAVHRARQVRRGYVKAHAPVSALAGGVLGRA